MPAPKSQPERRRRDRSGGLVVWKPAGMTSRRALEKAERKVRVRRLGHAGTLDPLACGILVLLGGEGRKFQNLLTSHTKEYVARVILGLRSASEDAEGPLWCVVPRPELPDTEELEEVVSGFRGTYRHTPPRLSAVRIQGRRSYQRARRGEDVEPDPRTVTLHEVELVSYEAPVAIIRVVCDAGTYIRSLVRDIGDELGTGAFLGGLRRTRVGDFDESEAVPIHRLREESWLPLEDLLRREPSIEVDDDHALRLSQGQRVELRAGAAAPGGNVAEGGRVEQGPAIAWSRDRILGLVEIWGRDLHPRRWLAPRKAPE